MTQKNYKTQHIERAHWWLAKAIDTLAEAEILVPDGQTRLGAYSRLYYSAHHMAVALLRLIGNNSKKHDAIINQFGKEWVQSRGFPPGYGKLLNSLYHDRNKADYGEYVPSMQKDLEKLVKMVRRFVNRGRKEIPPVSTAKILSLLVQENPTIRDFSFDMYCPRSYYHHTRLTVWCPKGRVTDAWLRSLKNTLARSLQVLHVKEAKDYVIGLNSRVNQYEERHVIMLDFDNISTLPSEQIGGEPGLLFRTGSGFHFIGACLYNHREWKIKMKKFSKIASKQHIDLSLKRGYATLRLTCSSRKPFVPAYIGRSR